MKVAIITGASKGIGKATAEKFFKNGYKVLNLSRTENSNTEVINIKIDLNNIEGFQWSDNHIQLLQSADEISLIHCAAKLKKDSVISLDQSDFMEVLKINLVAPLSLNQKTLPFMKPNSSILFVGSTLSEIGVPGAASYIASKHGLAGLMKATTQDLIGKGIHTTLICPGFTNTEMLRKHLNNDESILESLGKNNSFGRLIEPKEIAEIIYLSAQNPVLNGSILHSNLGQIQN